MTYGTYTNQVANNKDFVVLLGETIAFTAPMVPSVAIPMGRFVSALASGLYDKATNATTGALYLLEDTIASTDADYATSAKLKSVRRGSANGGYRVEFTPTGGALTASNVGDLVNLDATGQFINITVVGTQFEILEVISATRGIARVLA